MYLKVTRSKISATVEELLKDSLFRNAVYQMLGTGVLALFGFIFWLFAAKLVSTEVIGLATTLLASANLVAVLSLIGFDTSLVRFLSHSTVRNDKINTSMLLVGCTSLVLSSLFVLAAPAISPHLSFIQDRPMYTFLFIVFCITFSLQFITGAIFLAYRKTQYPLVINALFSVVKIALPFLFVSWGAFGIFTAAALAQTVGFALSICALMYRFEYRPKFVYNHSVVSRVWKYSVNNYIADILNLLPLSLLPIIITNKLGPSSAAYFYIIMMIGSLLYMIPASTSRSLLAEGSHNEIGGDFYIWRSMRTMAIFLIPSILVLLLGGKYILAIFGPHYVSAASFLYIIALSGIPVGFYSLFCSLLRIHNDGRALIAVNAIYAVSILGLTYMLLPLGLFGIGLGWLSGYIITSVASFIFYRHYQQSTHNTGPSIAEKWDDFKLLILSSKIYYLRARLKGRKRKTLLCYPQKPLFFHSLYMVSHYLGYRVINNPALPFDAAMVFEDITHRGSYPELQHIPASKLINSGCYDIGKVHVDEVFTRVFGYSSFVDPRTHVGICVKKSNSNAMHDGKVIQCPVEPEEGYIYQKLIDNQVDEKWVIDYRIPVYGGKIPFCNLRYKSIDDRFDSTLRTVISDCREHLSDNEIAAITRFCKEFKLDYGELDMLRDKKDGLLYIVDVNTTPGAPRPSSEMNSSEFKRFISGLSNAFDEAFVQ